MEWLDGSTRIARRGRENGVMLPEFDEFWRAGHVEYPWPEKRQVFLEDFRSDPKRTARTPSGLIELYSEQVAGFGYRRAPGPSLLETAQLNCWERTCQSLSVALLSNQPATRLHSQYDHGKVSRATKSNDREPITISTGDAGLRGIRDGDVVRVFNDRGEMLAGAMVTDNVRPGVVQIATGAWYDPLEAGEIGTSTSMAIPTC